MDYFPFGLEMYGRKYNSNTYRFGFNGKENDREYGSQLVQDYGFRIYNPSIGRFLSVDPLAPEYPFYTPYQFAGNKPIFAVDLDGLEEKPSIRSTEENRAVVREAITAMRSVDGHLPYYRHLNMIMTRSNYAAFYVDKYANSREYYNGAFGYVGQAIAAHSIESSPISIVTNFNYLVMYESEFLGADLIEISQPLLSPKLDDSYKESRFTFNVISNFYGSKRDIKYRKYGSEASEPYVVVYEVKTTTTLESTMDGFINAVNQLEQSLKRVPKVIDGKYEAIPIVVLDEEMWEMMSEAARNGRREEKLSSAMGLLNRMNGGVITIENLSSEAAAHVEELSSNVRNSSDNNSSDKSEP